MREISSSEATLMKLTDPNVTVRLSPEEIDQAMTNEETIELQRMLLWFKAQLPPHAIEEWYISVMPYPPPEVIEDTDTKLRHSGGSRGANAWKVEGYGRCTRCGRRFDIPKSGNAIASDHPRIEATVQKMKEWVLRDAERGGPCWGDVPALPRNTWQES